MLLSEKIHEAASFIAGKTEVKPAVAVILGSGLGALAEKVVKPTVIDYKDIPFWPRSTAPGHAGRLVIGEYEHLTVAMMQGRVHYYEGYTMDEVTFPTRVLGKLGVSSLIVTNAAGGIDVSVPAGTIYAITDHINYMGTNPLIGANLDDFGPRFPDMTYAYDREYIQKLELAAQKTGIKLAKGVYMAFSGPSFETPAEIRMARLLGADLAGMSTVPEVIAANHMGLRVCGISCVANYAAGITENKLSHQEVLSAMGAASDSLIALVSQFLKEL
jgi:purine-nucleoside phosphorylase